MTRQLPPLNCLRFFESVARLGNLTRVAEELHVTPSAVSHSIHTLENWFGARLFDRSPRRLDLTAAGRAFLPSVRSALQLISDATEQVAGQRAGGRLALSAGPTFAGRWLVPRLPRFASRHPDISVALDTSGRPEARVPDGADLEIRCCSKPPAAVSSVRLLGDVLVPVCSPRLAGPEFDRAPEQFLDRLPLLRVTDGADDWAAWSAGAGISIAQTSHELTFGAVHIALEAAKQGLGIAIGHRVLIEADLQTKQLIALPLPEVAAPSSYWLLGAGATFERRETRAFRRWLMDEIRSSRVRMPGPDRSSPSVEQEKQRAAS